MKIVFAKFSGYTNFTCGRVRPSSFDIRLGFACFYDFIGSYFVELVEICELCEGVIYSNPYC